MNPYELEWEEVHASFRKQAMLWVNVFGIIIALAAIITPIAIGVVTDEETLGTIIGIICGGITALIYFKILKVFILGKFAIIIGIYDVLDDMHTNMIQLSEKIEELQK